MRAENTGWSCRWATAGSLDACMSQTQLFNHGMAVQTRLEEKNAAIAKMQQAESITAQLMERLEKDQAGQVERMNQAMQMSEEMVRNAPSC